MLKSSSFSFIAFILVLSILGPSIDALMSFGSQTEEAYVIDFNEEENNQNESEKKFDEKELFFDNPLDANCFYVVQRKNLNELDEFSTSQFDSEIVPPPPKFLV